MDKKGGQGSARSSAKGKKTQEFVHFGSKEKLEMAVVERAYDIFNGRILLPAEEEVTPGIERVWTLCNLWLEFIEDRMLPGGYFFTGAFLERAPQDGDIARRVRQIVDEWLTALRRAIDQARSRGEIRREVDGKRTAFQLNSLLIGAQWSHLQSGRDQSKARSAILTKLGNLATDDIPATAFESVKEWDRYLESRHE